MSQTDGISSETSNTMPTDERGLKVLINKLKNQNDNLRTQLKQLNVKLTETLDKVKPRNPKGNDPYKPHEFKEETIHKEIENSNKQIEMYKKELAFLRERAESFQSDYKVIQLENMIKERNLRIQDLQAENKNLEKAKKDQERELDKYYDEQQYIAKMNSSAEDVKALRQKLRELTEKSRTEEHHFKKQEEYIEKLKKTYVENCGRLKVEPNLEQPQRLARQTLSPKNQSLKNRNKSKRAKSVKDDGDDDEHEDVMQVNEANFIKLKKRKKIIKHSMGSLGKKYGRQNDLINNKAKKFEDGKAEYERKTKDKEKEIELLSQKVAQYKKMVRHNQLEPINGKEKLNRSVSREEFKKAEVNLKKEPALRHEVIGKAGSKNFDDKSQVSGKSIEKIVKLIVWFDDENIFGVQAWYSSKTGDFCGNENVNSAIKNSKKSASIEIDNDDYISYIMGKYNSGIVSLRVQTFKGQIKEFGNVQNEGDEYDLTIKQDEKVSPIFGSFIDKLGNEVLASLGVNLSKDDNIEEDIGDISKKYY